MTEWIAARYIRLIAKKRKTPGVYPTQTFPKNAVNGSTSMHQYTQTTQSQQDHRFNMQSDWNVRAHKVAKTTKPEKRSMEEAMRRTGKSREQLEGEANQRRRWLAYRRVHKRVAEMGPGWHSLRDMIAYAKSDRRTIKEALKHTMEHIALQLREAFRSLFIYQGTNREGGDVPDGSNQHGDSFFASLSKEYQRPRSLRECIQRAVALAAGERFSTVKRSGTARNKSDEAKLSLNISAIDKDTGEVSLCTNMTAPRHGHHNIQATVHQVTPLFKESEAKINRSLDTSLHKTAPSHSPILQCHQSHESHARQNYDSKYSDNLTSSPWKSKDEKQSINKALITTPRHILNESSYPTAPMMSGGSRITPKSGHYLEETNERC